MNLEDKVVNLELSKRLKELGIKQESLFYWQFFHGHDFIINHSERAKQYTTETYSAFTVSELIELLPIIQGCPLQLMKGDVFGYGIMYFCRYDILNIDNTFSGDKNPSNSCAKMLIYLIENKLIGINEG